MNVWKREQQKKLIEERRLRSAYLSALKTIVAKFSRTTFPSASAIRKVLLKRVGRIAVAVYKKSLVNNLNIVEQLFGRPIPVLQKSSIELAKVVEAEDLVALGLATDLKLIEEVGMVNVKTVSQNFHGVLRRTHAAMIEEGAAVGDIAVAFQGAVSELESQSISVARRIAKTETTRIYNKGSLDAYEKSNVVGGKEWSTNTSGNPRTPPDSEFDHLAADGEVVPVDKPFVKTGESLMYPGDPSGSPGNIINCECAQLPVINIR